ncbi:glycogen debranching protein GlgX [Marinicellulosiphila megalodicopiae]|uniref:glycogen debranching protein GlgX n=1 Tax=Marinicellulosiphila megalodicopiae TaxID=2724896 RepID=UPI003BAF6DB6
MPQALAQTPDVEFLGVVKVEQGFQFTVLAPQADSVFLCLFEKNHQELADFKMEKMPMGRWSIVIEGIDYGQYYGYRTNGEYNPEVGKYFNTNYLLIDPRAQALSNPLITHQRQLGEATPIDRDNQSLIPKSVVVDQSFDWQGVTAPNHAWDETILYEVHVKGFSYLRSDLPISHRGKYLAFTHQPLIDHLVELGITAVQLLPCFASATEQRLDGLGLRNYWGYNPINFFAPEPRFATEDANLEFKQMVQSLHKNNIEVIMDVVYNHSAESSKHGSVLSHKGLDGPLAYYLDQDFTGCGNSFNLTNFTTLQLVLDSMRHWVTTFHVDGFRFDLAATLGRENATFNHYSAFFKCVEQDPILSKIKLIAEPWDIGYGGYQVGNFPAIWYECNDKFRDQMRHFWHPQEHCNLAEFALRLMGSTDCLAKQSPKYSQSINYICYHDGFCLEDFVSYNDKHNHINGEENRDGHGHNISYNHGAEGKAMSHEMFLARQKHKRNLMATLLLSQGVVHLLGGDEIGRTQNGNNNAYCQDNHINWFNWDLDESREQFLSFMQSTIKLRQSSELLRKIDLTNQNDVSHWYRFDGYAMTTENWESKKQTCLQLLLSNKIENPVINLHLSEQYFLILINASQTDKEATLPCTPQAGWEVCLDTNFDKVEPKEVTGEIMVTEHSLIVLKRKQPLQSL